MCFDILTTRLRFERAFSSMAPVELNTKQELSRMASKKIRVPWSVDSSNAPIPSESIIKIEHGRPSFVLPSTW